MIIDFDKIELKVLENFRGGEKATEAHMFTDGQVIVKLEENSYDIEAIFSRSMVISNVRLPRRAAAAAASQPAWPAPITTISYCNFIASRHVRV